MREIAENKKITLEELSKKAEKEFSIDKLLDERQIEIGKNEDNFIIDGRLSAHFIPNSIKIFLTAELKERAKRVFEANRTLEKSSSIEKAMEQLAKRQESEIKRYLKWYNYNPYELNTYDIVFDSTNEPIDEVVDSLFSKINELYNEKK